MPPDQTGQSLPDRSACAMFRRLDSDFARDVVAATEALKAGHPIAINNEVWRLAHMLAVEELRAEVERLDAARNWLWTLVYEFTLIGPRRRTKLNNAEITRFLARGERSVETDEELRP